MARRGPAGRARELLAELTDIDEHKIFGGLAFMVNTRMACAIVGADLMVRVGTANHDAASHRRQPGASADSEVLNVVVISVQQSDPRPVWRIA